jgi:predicted glycoside hydrolase/deacetylase ChbG (UPF0249 family)
MDATRYLVVIADDFGIGPETSRGILELACRGIITGTVLLANSPHAEQGVREWRRLGAGLEMGWHPCLTVDPPAAGAGRVPSLVGPDGCLWPLRQFIPRLVAGLLRADEIAIELEAQYLRFVELVGRPPAVVNSHQHVAVFPPVGRILRGILARRRPLPYLRRVREPWRLLADVPGARIKRAVLSSLGQLEALGQDRQGFPGNEWFCGTTDPPWVRDPEFFARWLDCVPGRVVELACHPGHHDDTLPGRDCKPGDGLQRRRVDELHLLLQPRFEDACRRAAFRRVPPSALLAGNRGLLHAA